MALAAFAATRDQTTPGALPDSPPSRRSKLLPTVLSEGSIAPNLTVVGAPLEDFAKKYFCATNSYPIVFVGLIAMALDQKTAEWLPLHVALAWVFTRDENFTYQVARFVNPNLEIALNLYRYASDDDGAPPVIENETEAWRQLRQAISASSVRARGVPYDLSSPPKDKLEIESRPLRAF